MAIVAGVAVAAGYRAARRRRAAGMVRLAETIPVHSKWWRDRRDHAGDLVYVALGDSAAQGIGASRPDRGYVGMLAAAIRVSTGKRVRLVNLSRSGARLREALAEQVPQLARLAPDVVTVGIGANDIADFDRDRFTREFDELCRQLPPHSIVAEVPAFYFGPAARDAGIANGIVQETAARYGLTVAELHGATLRQTGIWYALNQVAADFFHPNDRGYRVWTSAFSPHVARRLEAVTDPSPRL